MPKKKHLRRCPECGSHTIILRGKDNNDLSAHCQTCNNVWKDEAVTSAIEKEAEYHYIRKEGDKWCVWQKSSGKTLHCHDSKEEAEEAFRGMMMNKHQNVEKEAVQKGSPYPSDSYKNAPDHSPKGQKKWPAEVNAIYNACMRDHGDESSERSKSKCAAIAWSKYKATVKEKGRGNTSHQGAEFATDKDIENYEHLRNHACPACMQGTVEINGNRADCPNCGWRGKVNQLVPATEDTEGYFHSKVREYAPEHFLETLDPNVELERWYPLDKKADRADYKHWNEDADRMWWEEEGKHPYEPPEEDFEQGMRAEDAAWEELYAWMQDQPPDYLYDIIEDRPNSEFSYPYANQLPHDKVQEVAKEVLEDLQHHVRWQNSKKAGDDTRAYDKPLQILEKMAMGMDFWDAAKEVGGDISIGEIAGRALRYSQGDVLGAIQLLANPQQYEQAINSTPGGDTANPTMPDMPPPPPLEAPALPPQDLPTGQGTPSGLAPTPSGQFATPSGQAPTPSGQPQSYSAVKEGMGVVDRALDWMTQRPSGDMYVCMDCGKNFSSETPQPCPKCGSSHVSNWTKFKALHPDKVGPLNQLLGKESAEGFTIQGLPVSPGAAVHAIAIRPDVQSEQEIKAMLGGSAAPTAEDYPTSFEPYKNQWPQDAPPPPGHMVGDTGYLTRVPSNKDFVIVANVTSADDMYLFLDKRCKGVIAMTGGTTSHAVVEARALGLFAITDAKGAEKIQPGDTLTVKIDFQNKIAVVDVNSGGEGPLELTQQEERNVNYKFIYLPDGTFESRDIRGLPAEQINARENGHFGIMDDLDIDPQTMGEEGGCMGVVYSNGQAEYYQPVEDEGALRQAIESHIGPVKSLEYIASGADAMGMMARVATPDFVDPGLDANGQQRSVTIFYPDGRKETYTPNSLYREAEKAVQGDHESVSFWKDLFTTRQGQKALGALVGAIPASIYLVDQLRNLISKTSAHELYPGKWYTMTSPKYKVPDVIQVLSVDDSGVEVRFQGDEEKQFPKKLEDLSDYTFEPHETHESKTARKNFTQQQQTDLVNENKEGKARNSDKLDLSGTHYTPPSFAIVKRRDSDNEMELSFLW
jgi:phosphohistidine swiveling domain-containing protein/predicted RNA-binding Zn-ribbon protein involved in translation (DUF1610 family)